MDGPNPGTAACTIYGTSTVFQAHTALPPSPLFAHTQTIDGAPLSAMAVAIRLAALFENLPPPAEQSGPWISVLPLITQSFVMAGSHRQSSSGRPRGRRRGLQDR